MMKPRDVAESLGHLGGHRVGHGFEPGTSHSYKHPRRREASFCCAAGRLDRSTGLRTLKADRSFRPRRHPFLGEGTGGRSKEQPVVLRHRLSGEAHRGWTTCLFVRSDGKRDRSNFSGKQEGRWEGSDGDRGWVQERGGIDDVHDWVHDEVCDKVYDKV